MHIALIQMTVADGNPLDNLRHADELIRSYPDANLYLLPELWASGYARSSWQEYADQHHKGVIQAITSLAKKQNAWIGGSYVVRHKSGFANRFILIPPDDSDPITYDKMRLLSLFDEDKLFVSGKRRVHANINEWHANLSICFDLRFPEVYRKSALEGTELFLIVAQWPKERCHHMVAIARARAIENQAYVAVCNRIGISKKGLDFGGESGIWAPDGTQLANAKDRECVVVTEIKREMVHKTRKELPFLVP